MRQKSQTRQTGAAKAIKDIRRATRKQYSAEEKIRIVLDGLRGEETIAELCRGEAPAARQHLPYRIKLPCSEDSYPMAGMKVLSVQGFNLGTKLALFLAVLQNPGKRTDADA